VEQAKFCFGYGPWTTMISPAWATNKLLSLAETCKTSPIEGIARDILEFHEARGTKSRRRKEEKTLLATSHTRLNRGQEQPVLA
jgi:hypothetical protein